MLLNRKRLSFWWDFALARRFRSPWQFLRRNEAALGSENKWLTSRVVADGRTGRCQIYAGERLRNIALRVHRALHGRKPCDSDVYNNHYSCALSVQHTLIASDVMMCRNESSASRAHVHTSVFDMRQKRHSKATPFVHICTSSSHAEIVILTIAVVDYVESLPAVKEPSGLLRSDGKRPDGLTLIPWQNGRSVTWDVTVTDTVAQSYLPVTSASSDGAAETAAERKTANYLQLAQTYTFVPIAVETLWPMNNCSSSAT